MKDDFCPFCMHEERCSRQPLIAYSDILIHLEHIRHMRQEYFVSLSLDNRQQLIKYRIVTIGLVDAVLAHPREVFAGPLADRASSIIIAHNHPSGVVDPSEQDIQVTNQLLAAGQLLGIHISDHIIVTTQNTIVLEKAG